MGHTDVLIFELPLLQKKKKKIFFCMHLWEHLCLNSTKGMVDREEGSRVKTG